MRFFIFLYSFLMFSSFSVYAQNYQPGKLFAKLKSSDNIKISPDNLNHVWQELGIQSMVSFGDMLTILNGKNSITSNRLSSLFEIKYANTSISPDKACALLMTTAQFEYVEPQYTYDLLYVPNDPYSDTNQVTFDADYLLKHQTLEAWDIEQGDTNVVIGIVDNGFLVTHEDLVNQIKYNPADTLGNGENDDNDYFYYDGNFYPLTDNYAGWDIADFDNDVTLPNPNIDAHGTKVAGCSSAEVNNGLGIAGTGYKCKFLPIKASTDVNPYGIDYGFFGLLLAAQQGCKVINLSWGYPYAYSMAVQDLINAVVLDYDATVVAAAGNTPNEYADYYPACYDNVISVASTRMGNTMYGKVSYFTDLNGLGRNVRMTDGDTTNSYILQHGSSYSAPMVAGAIALVRSQRPHLNAIQAGEQVRVTGDVVDTLSYTIQYKEQMGRSLNMYRALTDSTLPSIRVINHEMATKDGLLTYSGDSITLSVNFINYLAASTATDVEISIISDNAKMVDSVFNLGSISTMDSTAQDFTYYLYAGATAGDSILFRAGFEDGNYQDYQYFVWIVEDNTEIITSKEESLFVDEEMITAVYPNPFDQELFFSIKKPISTEIEYEIYDMESRPVYHNKLTTNSMKNKLPLPSLSSGMYILTVQTPQREYHYKLIKL